LASQVSLTVGIGGQGTLWSRLMMAMRSLPLPHLLPLGTAQRGSGSYFTGGRKSGEPVQDFEEIDLFAKNPKDDMQVCSPPIFSRCLRMRRRPRSSQGRMDLGKTTTRRRLRRAAIGLDINTGLAQMLLPESTRPETAHRGGACGPLEGLNRQRSIAQTACGRRRRAALDRPAYFRHDGRTLYRDRTGLRRHDPSPADLRHLD
jgi:hypothetical protein